jgi:group I intron endonuclease
MACGVYELWFGPYFYQGSSRNIDRRIKAHLKSLSNGKHDNPKMQRVYDKYGHTDKCILIECEDGAHWGWEQQFIDANWGDEKYLNLTKIATGTSKDRLSASRKGRKHSAEARAAISRGVSLAQKGVKRGPYSPERISAAAAGQRGRKLTGEHKEKLRAANLGKKNGPCSPERKEKLRAAKLGQTHSDETKALLRAKARAKAAERAWQNTVQSDVFELFGVHE